MPIKEFVNIMVIKELVKMVEVEGLKLTQADKEKFTDNLLEKIKETLANGEPVKIHGFGQLELVKKNARVGMNPKTKEKINIPESKTVKLKVSKTYRKSLSI